MADDLWTQFYRARRRYRHDDKDETLELREARDREIEAELAHPQCCDLARTHIFPYREIRGNTVLNDGVPSWKSSFPTSWKAEESTSKFCTMHFCPFCGTQLPALCKKKTPPAHIIIEDDGHCGGCEERYGRFGACFCSHPESAYEVAPVAGF